MKGKISRLLALLFLLCALCVSSKAFAGSKGDEAGEKQAGKMVQNTFWQWWIQSHTPPPPPPPPPPQLRID